MAASLSPALVLQLKLMVREAEKRFADAEALQSAPVSTSDSGYLLQLLGFELLLKACVKAHRASFGRNHSYIDLWRKLPSDVQTKLLAAAQNRMAGVADYSDLSKLLKTWSQNFVSLRYPYEKSEGLTPDQYRARSEAWVAAGAPHSQADFVYYPHELFGLRCSLREHLQAWMASHSA